MSNGWLSVIREVIQLKYVLSLLVLMANGADLDLLLFLLKENVSSPAPAPLPAPFNLLPQSDSPPITKADLKAFTTMLHTRQEAHEKLSGERQKVAEERAAERQLNDHKLALAREEVLQQKNQSAHESTSQRQKILYTNFFVLQALGALVLGSGIGFLNWRLSTSPFIFTSHRSLTCSLSTVGDRLDSWSAVQDEKWKNNDKKLEKIDAKVTDVEEQLKNVIASGEASRLEFREGLKSLREGLKTLTDKRDSNIRKSI